MKIAKKHGVDAGTVLISFAGEFVRGDVLSSLPFSPHVPRSDFLVAASLFFFRSQAKHRRPPQIGDPFSN